MLLRASSIYRVALTAAVLLPSLCVAPLQAQALVPQNEPRSSEIVPNELKNIDVIEHLGDAVPLDLTFVDDSGKTVQLKDYFNSGKPVLLNLAYYECPMLCTLVLNGVADAMKGINWLPGKEFQVVTISIDPTETAAVALLKKKAYLDYYGKAANPSGWAFLTGEEANIKKLAAAIGYQYYYDDSIRQYAHPAVTFLLTPDGKVARYLYGISYRPKDLRYALMEASQGRLGTTLERIVLSCYIYDPNRRGYVIVAMKAMRLGGGAAALLLATVLGVFWYRERTKSV